MPEMSEEQRVAAIIAELRRLYPGAKCTLDFHNPLELLIATILSAQCTDERVNMVTRSLFKKYHTAEDYAYANPEELEQDIRPTGFYKNKAKNIRAAARMLVEQYHGEVPHTMAELIKLPGVARKTANVVLGNAYGIVEGFVVDTHVARLARRLGLTKEQDPIKIERDLMARVPRENWLEFSHLLIHHGRAICQARKPLCPECAIAQYCPTGQEILSGKASPATVAE